MLQLTPVEVLTILARRLEQRAHELERVGLPGYDATIHELRRFAQMIYNARDYVAGEPPKRAGR